MGWGGSWQWDWEAGMGVGWECVEGGGRWGLGVGVEGRRGFVRGRGAWWGGVGEMVTILTLCGIRVTQLWQISF